MLGGLVNLDNVQNLDFFKASLSKRNCVKNYDQNKFMLNFSWQCMKVYEKWWIKSYGQRNFDEN